jgi:hypothetical protein
LQQKRARPFGLALSNYAGNLLLLKRHQRQPSSGAVKIVAKKEAIGLLHVGRYSMTEGRMCQVAKKKIPKRAKYSGIPKP